MKKRIIVIGMAVLVGVAGLAGCGKEIDRETSITDAEIARLLEEHDIQETEDTEDDYSSNVEEKEPKVETVDDLMKKTDAELLMMEGLPCDSFCYKIKGASPSKYAEYPEETIITGIQKSSTSRLLDIERESKYEYEVIKFPSSSEYNTSFPKGEHINEYYYMPYSIKDDDKFSGTYFLHTGEASDFENIRDVEGLRLCIVPMGYEVVHLVNSSLERVVTDWGVTTMWICSDNLREITISPDVTAITIETYANSNDELREDLVANVYEGTYGEEYCKEHGINYRYKYNNGEYSDVIVVDSPVEEDVSVEE